MNKTFLDNNFFTYIAPESIALFSGALNVHAKVFDNIIKQNLNNS